MNSLLAFLNGRLLPAGDATLSLADAGFVSGATVVDNARTFGGKLFRWADHLARFRRDCERCFVPLVATDAELSRTAEELLAQNLPLSPLGELHVVTAATPGPPGGPPTLAMTTYPIRVERYRPFFTQGVRLVVAGTQASEPTDLLPPRIKHRSRLHWHVAEQKVPPDAVAVVRNHGVADTAVGAIAAIAVDGTLLLPATGFVQESISLKVLRELAAHGFPVRESAFAADSPNVRELLLCGTGFGVAGVVSWSDSDHTRTFDWPGPAYRYLLAAWSKLVGVDIERQFTG
ncbi:aminotransferase class IV [Limnoglobus roseus]|uniref:Branched chain amino acid aminotransferase n=1 Tax=Limnoglobus roseus TaxID=2598579 RepID=A0A5C1AB32_9BACT|nr:aminotransferase class IV [Limnoglobus roseus]QEL15785.1 branched chain amino acid aminotransferase [Limnoglobus roseus]